MRRCLVLMALTVAPGCGLDAVTKEVQLAIEDISIPAVVTSFGRVVAQVKVGPGFCQDSYTVKATSHSDTKTYVLSIATTQKQQLFVRTDYCPALFGDPVVPVSIPVYAPGTYTIRNESGTVSRSFEARSTD